MLPSSRPSRTPSTPPPTSSEDAPCKYLLDSSTSSTYTLPSGRRIGYATYGSPTGTPILWCHGWPGSRLEASAVSSTASKLNARIVAVDRPGFGWSSPHPNRTLLSYADDISALAAHLNLPKYGVLGISGGGPYALACARALPADKCKAVGIVCGLGSPDMGYSGMNWFHRTGWTFAGRMFPGLTRWFFSRQTEARLDLSDEERLQRVRTTFEKEKTRMNPKDLAFYEDVDQARLNLHVAREVYAQGMDAFSEDFKLLNSDFGFKIEDIRKDLPVQIWHGNMDNFVPLQHAEKVKARVGDNATLRVSEDTHASIFALRKEEFLGELVKAIEA